MSTFPLKYGIDPPTEKGLYVIERVGMKPLLYEVDVSGGCVWVNQFGYQTINRWNRMNVIRYRRIEFDSYLQEESHD